MKIGIDARFYGEAGPGRYTKNIVEHLEKHDKENKYVIFLRKSGFEVYNPQNPNFTKVLADYPWYSFAEQTLFLWSLLKQNLDLLYVPHFNIPILYTKKLVTAIPDMIMHTFSTEKGSTLPGPYFKLKRFIYKLVVKVAVNRSKKVIVPSSETLKDFLSAFPKLTAEKFVLAYEGVDPSIEFSDIVPTKILNKYNIQKPFLLYISSMYEHKNVPRLIEAFEIMKNQKNFNGQLVLVGKKDKYSIEIYKLVADKGLSDSIIMPGIENYVDDEEACVLRAAADMYIFPSLKEGFSLTPLEAMHFELPCVISDIPCHKEIYGDSVVYFDPKNVEDMAEKISTTFNNKELQKELIEKGNKVLLKYSWDNTAKITLDVFNNV